MKTKIMAGVVLALSLVLVGCDRTTNEIGGSFTLPKGMEDCSVYRMQSGGVNSKVLYVVRCPLSATSTMISSGKTHTYTSVIESEEIQLNGKTYVEKHE